MLILSILSALAVTAVAVELPSISDVDIINGFDRYLDECTSIGVGPKATIDGSTVTTHNNDCQECDFRITNVPAADWPSGSKRPLYAFRSTYPRYIETEDLNVHGPLYLKSNEDTTIFNWNISKPIAYIDQVPHTYAYTLGTYAIQNEKQLSIGESTCGAKFFAIPLNEGGKAAVEMSTLTQIALERCDTARCAIKTIGDIGVKYGFFGSGGWETSPERAQDEAGEALTIADKTETWMFHILPDDTGASAVWVAQRVPDDHITVVANQFVIQDIDLSDTKNYLASANIYDVAIRNNLWSKDSGIPFRFANIYAPSRLSQGFACTRRVWRIFTLAAPSLSHLFSPYTDGLATYGYGPNFTQPYPFSVKVDNPLTLQQIMNFNRDQYEGTPFDMTTGIDAGPFGDPMRYPPVSTRIDPIYGVSYIQYNQGLQFGRPISLARTAYSTVAQGRAHLPDEIGAVTWVAPYAPHHSTFVPIYPNAGVTPHSMNYGSLHKLNKTSNFWIHSIVGNYVSRWYKETIGDVVTLQKSIETDMFLMQQEAEQKALLLLRPDTMDQYDDDNENRRLLSAKTTDSKQNIRRNIVTTTNSKSNSNNNNNNNNAGTTTPSTTYLSKDAKDILSNFQQQAALLSLNRWTQFFDDVVVIYRDCFKLLNTHVEQYNLGTRFLGASRGWYESIGFWGPPFTPAPGTDGMPVLPINVPSLSSLEEYKTTYPQGEYTPYTLQSIPILDIKEGSSDNNNNKKESGPIRVDENESSSSTSTTSSSHKHSYSFTSIMVISVSSMIFGVAIGIVATMCFISRNNRYYSYLPIN